MRKLIEFFAARTFLVNLISVLLLVAGVVSALTLRRDLVPPFEFKVIQVNTAWPGSTALQIEKHVTVPFENAFKGLNGVAKVTSESHDGRSTVTIELNDAHDKVLDTLEEVRDASEQARVNFPEGVRPPSIQKGFGEPAWLASLAMKGVDPEKPADRARVRRVIDELNGTLGISEVYSDMPKLELQVRLDLRKLESLGVSGNEVRAAITRSLGTHAVGSVEANGEDVTLGFTGPTPTAATIEATVLRASRSGYLLRVRDVARVEFKLAHDSRIRLHNGVPYIELTVFKDKYGDLIEVHRAYEAKLAEIRAELPKEMSVVELDTGSSYLAQQLDVLTTDAIIGTVLVLLVLGYFLGLRAAAAAAFGIPIAYLGTFIAMQALGISLDLISIIAMILILGVLVDDAIVVTEAYVEKLKKGIPKRQAAVDAAMDMLPPVTAAIATNVIAFLPIVFAGGGLKEVFISIPIVVVSAFAIGWVECFFILPNHLEHFVKGDLPDRSVIIWMRNFYERSLRVFLRRRYWTLAATAAAFVIVFGMAAKVLKTSFSLSVGAPRIAVEMVLKDSTSPEATLAQIQSVQDWASAKVGGPIRHVYTSISKVWMDGKYREGARFASIRLVLDPSIPRAESLAKELEDSYRAELDALKAKAKTDTFESLTVGVRRPQTDQEKENVLTLTLTGKESVAVSELVTEIEASLKDVKGLVSVSSDENLIKTQWNFRPDAAALSRFGLSPAEVAQQIQDLLDQQELDDVEIDGEAVSLKTALGAESAEPRFADLAKLGVLSAAGLRIPLSTLGTWKEEQVVAVWHRERGYRNIQLQAKFNPAATTPADFRKDVEARTKAVRDRFPSYTLKTELLSEQEQKNRDWMIKTLTYCLVGIIFVLALQFQSVTQPALVALAIPFGFFGALIAYMAHGEVLNLMGMLGLLGVAGVSANDAIVLTDSINELEKEKPGARYLEALVQGGRNRLQPMLLNSVTTLVGLFPMAYSWGGESGFTKPIAFTMAWGLTSSFLLTLYVLPAILMVRKDFLGWIGRRAEASKNLIFRRVRFAQSAPRTAVEKESLHPPT